MRYSFAHRLHIHWYAFMHNARLKAMVDRIIFGTDTYMGRMFDIILITFIILSVLIVMFESAHWLPLSARPILHVVEWIFTAFFTIEYLMRLYCAKKPREYALSFFGLVDFFSTFPSYLAVFFPSMHGFIAMRMFRILRVFRIFKLFDYMTEGHLLMMSLKASMRKIVVFFLFSVVMVVALGTIMYIVEHRYNDNFNSIPSSIYWATVTMTTVGYGDITPVTVLGRFFAGVVMLIGYTVLAVPTGIFTVSMVNLERERKKTQCPRCSKSIEKDSHFCMHCGFDLTSITTKELHKKDEDESNEHY